jgi:hypothetical protein
LTYIHKTEDILGKEEVELLNLLLMNEVTKDEIRRPCFRPARGLCRPRVRILQFSQYAKVARPHDDRRWRAWPRHALPASVPVGRQLHRTRTLISGAIGTRRIARKCQRRVTLLCLDKKRIGAILRAF